MKDKLSKIKSVIKKKGFWGFMKAFFKYIKSELGFIFSLTNRFDFFINQNRYQKYINKVLKRDSYDRIIVWRSNFGWNVPLYQRPQHISNNLSKQRCLIFYEVTTMTDQVNTIHKLQNNLYLVNFKNQQYTQMLFKTIDDINKPKYLQFYSTEWELNVKTVKDYIKKGYKIIYEYIDELSPTLSGTKDLPVNVRKKYDYAMQDTKNVLVVVTADLLKKDVISKRGEANLVFSSNGVDYDFLQIIDHNFKFEKEFKDLMDDTKPLIGYYGALAKWFDYELIKKIANTDKYKVVLFGIKYDDSYNNSKLDGYKNVYFLGSRDYKVLKNYASKIDILTIPFLINDITKATSPIKVFEYMALKKPIVTTNMPECKKYKSVLIGKNHQEFINQLDKALELRNDDKYMQLLETEAKNNDWQEKAKVINDLLIRSE